MDKVHTQLAESTGNSISFLKVVFSVNIDVTIALRNGFFLKNFDWRQLELKGKRFLVTALILRHL